MKLELLTYDELNNVHQQKANLKVREDLFQKYKAMGIKPTPLKMEYEVKDEIERQLFIQLEGFSVYMFNRYECKL